MQLLKNEISHLKGKITKLKYKLANNQEQWVQTFQQIQEQNRLLMINTGKASNLLQHDTAFLRTYNILDHRMQINYTNNINSCYMLKQVFFLNCIH